MPSQICPARNTPAPSKMRVWKGQRLSGRRETTEILPRGINSHCVSGPKETAGVRNTARRDNTSTNFHASRKQDAVMQHDAEDMAALCVGDLNALTRLKERHWLPMCHVAETLLGDEWDAEEVVAEAFVRIYRHRYHFNFRLKLTAWLYTIVRNLSLNRLRSRASQPDFVSIEEMEEDELMSQSQTSSCEPAADILLVQSEQRKELNFLLNLLPVKLRKPLELFLCDDISQIEIARRLGCTPKAVESRVYRARKELREVLRKSCLLPRFLRNTLAASHNASPLKR